MKVYTNCIVCQVQVRFKDIERLVKDEDRRFEIMRLIIEHLDDTLSSCRSRLDSRCVPTVIATNLFRIVKNATGDKDPYREAKKQANKEALKLYKGLENLVESIGDLRDKLYTALKISLVGNLIDLGVAGYIAPETSKVIDIVNDLEVLGDVEPCLITLLKSKKIAMILDNAGEAVFDRILANVLRSEGKYVVAIVKGGAFQNDVTYLDAEDAGLRFSFDEVYSTGTDASSVFIEEVDESLLEILKGVDVVVSKGMANYEYITEIELLLGVPIIYMLIAKCLPVAKDLGVPLGKAVIKLSNYLVR
ncbi:MAG: ARMT1-like domain-containing protein [Ignisphaera sp.]